jgi:alpha-ketoglutarate-dependent taurine dioxygenase
MGNTEIEVRPLTGTIGAEVFGIDLSNDLDEAARAALRRAFLD